MPLKDVSSSHNGPRLRLTECPLPDCRADLSGPTKTSHHFYSQHRPEDFGLSPLGVVPPDHDRPLFADHQPGRRVAADGGHVDPQGGDRR